MDFKIRKAEKKDCRIIAEFNAKMAEETEGLTLDSIELQKGVEAVMEDETKGFYIMAESEGQSAACLLITKEWSDWRNCWWWWIQSVYVKKTFRRQGLFSKMYEYVKKLSINNKTAGLRLYVDKENDSAQKVYKVCGMNENNYVFFEEGYDNNKD